MISLLIKNLGDELNKFMIFVFHDNAYKYNVSLNIYEKLVCVYCNRKVYSLYKQANPFVVLDAKYSPAPPSIVNKVRLKKKLIMSSLTNLKMNYCNF